MEGCASGVRGAGLRAGECRDLQNGENLIFLPQVAGKDPHWLPYTRGARGARWAHLREAWRYTQVAAQPGCAARRRWRTLRSQPPAKPRVPGTAPRLLPTTPQARTLGRAALETPSSVPRAPRAPDTATAQMTSPPQALASPPPPARSGAPLQPPPRLLQVPSAVPGPALPGQTRPLAQGSLPASWGARRWAPPRSEPQFT